MSKIIISALLFICVFSQYNPELSKNLCQLTVASYCRPTLLLDWSCGPCKNSPLEVQNITLFVNSTKATLGYIAISKKLASIGKPFSNISNCI